MERACPLRIRIILTDNGKEFTDRLFGLRKRTATGAHEFDTLCAALNIEHRLTPPKSPQTNGMVERFNGRIEEVLQSHHFRSGEQLETTLHRYVWLYNQQLPQSTLGSKTPLQTMKDWHKIKPELFKKQPHYLPGCDTYRGGTTMKFHDTAGNLSFQFSGIDGDQIEQVARIIVAGIRAEYPILDGRNQSRDAAQNRRDQAPTRQRTWSPD